jgi:ornithine carbamoyltransferase
MIQTPLAKSCRHFLSATDLSQRNYLDLIDSAIKFKETGRYPQALAEKSAALLFEKPSLRTRVSFEAGIYKLGGQPIYLDHNDSTIGTREPVRDLAGYLSRTVGAIVARVHDHDTLQELAEFASVPVVNALSDREHPCQALADLITIYEKVGTFKGTRLVYIGDGNNVCHSLMLASAVTGLHLTVVTPEGYGPDNRVIEQATAIADMSGVSLRITTNIDAVAGHNVVYADTWTSMGQDSDRMKHNLFARYKVTSKIMQSAGDGLEGNAMFMHCMPAYRGIEVDSDVIDGPSSIVYDQAENRMYAQNALLAALLTNALESSEV